MLRFCKSNGLGGQFDLKKSTFVVGEKEYQLAKCLPKGSSFACQVEAALFQRYSRKENVDSAAGLVCNVKSACLTINEHVKSVKEVENLQNVHLRKANGWKAIKESCERSGAQSRDIH